MKQFKHSNLTTFQKKDLTEGKLSALRATSMLEIYDGFLQGEVGERKRKEKMKKKNEINKKKIKKLKRKSTDSLTLPLGVQVTLTNDLHIFFLKLLTKVQLFQRNQTPSLFSSLSPPHPYYSSKKPINGVALMTR